MDGTTRAILKQITNLGYAVFVRESGFGHEVTAIHSASGERYGVTDRDLYAAACQLADTLGVDLQDG
jgi:hypothetical protein